MSRSDVEAYCFAVQKCVSRRWVVRQRAPLRETQGAATQAMQSIVEERQRSGCRHAAAIHARLIRDCRF